MVTGEFFCIKTNCQTQKYNCSVSVTEWPLLLEISGCLKEEWSTLWNHSWACYVYLEYLHASVALASVEPWHINAVASCCQDVCMWAAKLHWCASRSNIQVHIITLQTEPEGRRCSLHVFPLPSFGFFPQLYSTFLALLSLNHRVSLAA